MASIVLYFTTNTDTMIATKALRDAGIVARMVPLPTTVQSSANLGLTIDSAAEPSAMSAIKGVRLAPSGVIRSAA